MAWQIVAQDCENSLGYKTRGVSAGSYRRAGKPSPSKWVCSRSRLDSAFGFGSALDTPQATIERSPDPGVTHVVERQDAEAVGRIAVADAVNGIGEAERAAQARHTESVR
jgi:hypothetical protein